MIAGPTPKGVNAPKIANEMMQATTTIATQISLDHLRAWEPSRSSMVDPVLPSTGISSQPARYSTKPTPPLNASRATPTRIRVGSTPR
jgi:hypothetical protein